MQADSSYITTPLTGTLRVPGDKSCSHRAVMFAARAEGNTFIHGLLEGEDVLATIGIMRQMGAAISKDGGIWHVRGVGESGFSAPPGDLDCGNSGTSARLLCGLLAGCDFSMRLVGDASLSKRPFGRVVTPLTRMGAVFDGDRMPLTLTGSASLIAIDYPSPVASAQVKSAVLLAGLSADGVTSVTEPVKSRDHTERLLPAFGVDVETDGLTVRIQGGQTLTAPEEPLFIPADPSSAAFPAVAALLVPGSDITLSGVGMNPTRIGLFDTLRDMGADISFMNERMVGAEPVADIRIKHSILHGITVPEDRIPSMIDEVPILAMAAALAEGITHIPGLAELRVKESDRLAIVAAGLQACGATVEEGKDSLTIHGTAGKALTGGASIAAALDHRIAMSFLILGAACETQVTIDDITPVNTSFPGFVSLMNGLGMGIQT